MARRKPRTSAGRKRKIAEVMREYKEGTLRSGGQRTVRNRKQAIAIALSEAGISRPRSRRHTDRHEKPR